MLLGEECTSPSVQASSYTPSDAQVLSHIPFVAEFSLSCANGAKNVNLYAEVQGAVVPVLELTDGRYQVGSNLFFTKFSHLKTEVQIRIRIT